MKRRENDQGSLVALCERSRSKRDLSSQKHGSQALLPVTMTSDKSVHLSGLKVLPFSKAIVVSLPLTLRWLC